MKMGTLLISSWRPGRRDANGRVEAECGGVSDPSVAPTKERSPLSLSLWTHPVDHALGPDQGVVLDYSGFDEVSDELDLHGARPLLGRRVLVIPLGRHRHGSSTQRRATACSLRSALPALILNEDGPVNRGSRKSEEYIFSCHSLHLF